MKVFFSRLGVAALLLSVCAGCGPQDKNDPGSVTLTLGAFTVPKEAYQKEIIPAFQSYWKNRTGQRVRFQESYEASGAQSRSIQAGFEADIAALSLEKDIEKLKAAGLITHDWKTPRSRAFVTRSVVIIAHRPGNPKNIRTIEDLQRPDVDVVYPSPKTSGGAMWVVNALYGAGLKLSEAAGGKQDPARARRLLKSVQRRVKVMDKSGRLSVTTFENGIGDALLTYENEALLRQKQGREFPYIVPEATILIENPVAVVDRNVEKHGNREVAEAFTAFLFTPESQRTFARYGFRPVDEAVAAEFAGKYPVPEHLFTIDYLGGWNAVNARLYGRAGLWPAIMRELADER